MSSRHIRALIILGLAGGLLATPGAVAAGGIACTTVCYVNAATGNDANGGASAGDAKATIQAGVDAVNAGGTVHVAAGSYAEDVTISKSLTLDGAQAGTPVAGRTFGDASESEVDGQITVAASNVTIDGFSLTHANTASSVTGILVKSSGSGATIENDILDTITSNGTAQAVYLLGGPDDVTVSGNRINDVHGVNSTKGVYSGDSNAADPSTNLAVDGNVISNVTSDAKGAYGVMLNNGNGSTSNTGLAITGNTISDLTGGGWVHAIGIEADAPGVSVTDNTISGLSSPGPDAVGVWFENEDTAFGSALVNRNSLAVGSAAYGIAVHPALTGGSVDGTCNWWGDPSGPSGAGSGTGSPVSASVTYSPWMTTAGVPNSCGPDLLITKHHRGTFSQLREGIYTIFVSNEGDFPTTDTVTVHDTLPGGLYLVSMSGSGWSCSTITATCTRSDSLGGHQAYPPIAVQVLVGPFAPTEVVNTATVSGGGELNTTNDTATDPTVISQRYFFYFF